MPSTLRHLIFAITCLIGSSLASAQNAAFAISGGYSHLHTSRTGLFYDRDGAYVDGEVTWRVPHLDFPLLLGGGVSGSGYHDERDAFGSDGGFFEDNTLFSDVGLFSIEGRAALPISSHLVRGLFVEPRIGLGLLVNEYSIDRQFPANGFVGIDTRDHTGAAFEVRPALRAGYSWGAGSVGAEVSYMAAWGDFGSLGAKATELRAGVFVRFRF